MAKYFKAEMRPKKSYAEQSGMTPIEHCSDEFKTQAAYKEALEQLLVSEGENLDNWFKPDVTQIDESEYTELFAALNDSDEDFDEEPEGGDFSFTEDFDFNDDEPDFNQDTGEVTQQKTTYRYFEFEKGHIGLIMTTQLESGKFNASFAYTKDVPMTISVLDKEFSSDENAAINAIGAYINHLTDIKNNAESQGVTVGAWYNKTIKGLGSDGENRLINSIINEHEASVILNQIDIREVVDGERNSDRDEVDFSSLIMAAMAHRDFKNQTEGFLAKLRTNFAEIFDGATDEQLSLAVETIEAMHKIGHLSNPEDCAESFELILDDGPDFEPEEGEAVKFPLTKKAIIETCESYKGEPRVDAEFAYSEFIGCINQEIAIDEVMAKYIDESVKNPHCFYKGVMPVQIAMNVGFSLSHDEAVKAGEPEAEAEITESEAFDIAIGGKVDSDAVVTEAEDDFFAALEKPAISTVNEDLEPEEDNQEISADDKEAKFKAEVEALNAQLAELKPGERLVIEGLDNDVYHACDGVSSTKLKVAMESLMKYDAKYVSKTMPQDEIAPDHFKVGNLFHTMTLEPHKLDKEYFMLPEDYEKPTAPQFDKYDAWVKNGKLDKKAAGKEYPTELMIERCGRHYELTSKANGRIIVDFEGWQKAKQMAEAVLSDDDTFRLANHSSLKSEISYFKVDEDTEMLIKCRPDMELAAICGDLKSVSLRSNPDEHYLINALRKEVFNRGYHISAAMYLDITGLKQWLWVFANKEEGYHWSAPIRASEDTLNRGHALYREYLEKIAEGHRTGVWPKPDSIQVKKINGQTVIPTI